MEEVVSTEAVETPKEPPKCLEHPTELLPCPVCAKLKAAGRAKADARRAMRADRTYKQNKESFTISNEKLKERIKAQEQIITSREKRIKIQKEALAAEREKRNVSK